MIISSCADSIITKSRSVKFPHIASRLHCNAYLDLLQGILGKNYLIFKINNRRLLGYPITRIVLYLNFNGRVLHSAGVIVSLEILDRAGICKNEHCLFERHRGTPTVIVV